MDATGHATAARIQWDASCAAPTRDLVRRGLANAGVDVVETRDADDAPVSIVVFEHPTTAVREQVRELSQDGLARVVAVEAPSRGRPLSSGVAWELLADGASDVLDWTDPSTPPGIRARLDRWREIDRLVESPAVRGSLVGDGPDWLILLREIVEVAHFTDASVLVTGESGTGKELVARLIHDLDPRPDKGELVIVDCTTVVPTLSGSEFFGHEKGAFTGATSSRDGAFALADSGTLFLDEVGELPATLQAELLRVIQEGMYKRVGSNTWRMTGFRLVCATNRDLGVELEAGRFRSDLFYRIAEWLFPLPSLRERSAEIPLLTRTFFRRLRPLDEDVAIDDAVLRLIAEREYPGNVRDLRQFVQRIAKRHVGHGPITVGDVPPRERRRDVAPVRAGWAVGPGRAGETSAAGDEGQLVHGNGHASAGPTSTGSAAEFDRAAAAALAAGASLADIKRQATDSAIRRVLAEEPTLARAAERLGVTTRALQLRQAADRSGPAGREAARSSRP